MERVSSKSNLVILLERKILVCMSREFVYLLSEVASKGCIGAVRLSVSFVC